MLGFIKKWKDKLTDIVDTRWRLVQLELIERTSILLSNIIIILIFVLIAFGFFLFLGFTLAELFANILGNRLIGYLSAVVMFLLCGYIIYLLRKKIVYKLNNLFVKILTEDNDDTSSSENK